MNQEIKKFVDENFAAYWNNSRKQQAKEYLKKIRDKKIEVSENYVRLLKIMAE